MGLVLGEAGSISSPVMSLGLGKTCYFKFSTWTFGILVGHWEAKAGSFYLSVFFFCTAFANDKFSECTICPALRCKELHLEISFYPRTKKSEL